MENEQSTAKTTTLKLGKETKKRLDSLKEHKRETYDDTLQNILSILSLCKVNPDAARRRLLIIDGKNKKSNKVDSTNQVKRNYSS